MKQRQELVYMASVNRSGVIVTYPDYSTIPKSSGTKRQFDFQDNQKSSRINRQKRQIANATDFIVNDGRNKALCFVLTCPVESNEKTVNRNLVKFLDNYRHEHKIKTGKYKGKTFQIWDYVWVREYQQNNRPHWHIIADCPFMPVGQLNQYWLDLWNYSGYAWGVRLNPRGTRFVQSGDYRAAFYLTKYFAKHFHGKEKKELTLNIRKFGISNEANKAANPIVTFENLLPAELPLRQFNCGHGVTYLSVKTTKNEKRNQENYNSFKKFFNQLHQVDN